MIFCYIYIVGTLVYMYYRNLTLLLEVRDLNQDLPREELDKPTQSAFIVVFYFFLVWCCNFSWILMNFWLGFISAAIVTTIYEGRRNDMTEE